jgi:hypothetical protein
MIFWLGFYFKTVKQNTFLTSGNRSACSDRTMLIFQSFLNNDPLQVISKKNSNISNGIQVQGRQQNRSCFPLLLAIY